MKTVKSYMVAIKEKYCNDKTTGSLDDELHYLSGSNIQQKCTRLLNEGLSAADEITFRNFFGISRLDLKRTIMKHPVDKFKPIVNFLNGNTQSIQSHYSIELMAVLVDFQTRPYKQYLWGETREEIVHKGDEIRFQKLVACQDIKDFESNRRKLSIKLSITVHVITLSVIAMLIVAQWNYRSELNLHNDEWFSQF